MDFFDMDNYLNLKGKTFDEATHYAEEQGYKLHIKVGGSYQSLSVNSPMGVIVVKLSSENIIIESKLGLEKV
jgi:hypothetical protein